MLESNMKNGRRINQKFIVAKYFQQSIFQKKLKYILRKKIVYSYYTNFEGNAINRMLKQHSKNRDLEGGKTKRRKVEIPIAKFLEDVIYDLLNRGYTLEDWQ